jgi:hypothetical protein
MTYAPNRVRIEYYKGYERFERKMTAEGAVKFLIAYKHEWDGYRVIDIATDRVLIQSEYKTGDVQATN